MSKNIVVAQLGKINFETPTLKPLLNGFKKKRRALPRQVSTNTRLPELTAKPRLSFTNSGATFGKTNMETKPPALKKTLLICWRHFSQKRHPVGTCWNKLGVVMAQLVSTAGTATRRVTSELAPFGSHSLVQQWIIWSPHVSHDQSPQAGSQSRYLWS